MGKKILKINGNHHFLLLYFFLRIKLIYFPFRPCNRTFSFFNILIKTKRVVENQKINKKHFLINRENIAPMAISMY